MSGGDVHRAVHAAARHLGRRIDVLDMDRVVLLVDPHLEAQQLDRAGARLELAFVDAVRHGADRGPRRGLAAPTHDGGERGEILQPVLGHEGEQPLAAERIGGDHRLDVAQHLVRIAHVAVQHAQQRLVGLAGLVELHRRDQHAFVEQLADHRRVLHAADVADMPDRAHQRDQPAVAEHRAHERDVEQVPGAEPRVVGHQHVAFLQRLGREMLEQRLHAARQGEVEQRHGARAVRQRVALRVEDLVGEVLALRDDQRIGGAADRLPHLLDDRDQPRPHDLEPDRIGLDARLGGFERHAGRHDRLRVLRGGDGDAQVARRHPPSGCRPAR